MTKTELIASLACLPDDAIVMVQLEDAGDVQELAKVETFEVQPDHPDSKPFAALMVDAAA